MVKSGQDSNGNRSLLDFLTAFYKDYKNKHYSLTDIASSLSVFTGANQEEFFKKYIHGTEVMPFEELLKQAGW